jgi:hypothetical protein
MSPKILEEKREEKDNVVKITRIVKDEIIGKIRLTLTITKDEITLRRWSAWGYGETRLRRVELTQPYKNINVVLAYDYGYEGEGKSHWRGVDIVPRNNDDVDMLMSKVKDFDSFAQVVGYLHDKCREISYFNVVECDISTCL